MSESEEIPRPRRKSRLGLLVVGLLLLGVGGIGLYGASWVNERRYFLVVLDGKVEVRKGRMLPVGHDPFVPFDPNLRKAYESFALPAGMHFASGTTMFGDRVELDQALYRVLSEATEFVLTHEQDVAVVANLSGQYISRIRALPGTNVLQRHEIDRLENDVAYVRAAGRLQSGVRALEDAKRMFEASVRSEGGRYRDGSDRAKAIEDALAILRRVATASAPRAEGERRAADVLRPTVTSSSALRPTLPSSSP